MKNPAIDLLQTRDAQVWAHEFCKMYGGDEQLMLNWFANAIETGYNEARRRYEQVNFHQYLTGDGRGDE